MADQPSGPQPSCTEVFHPRGESAVRCHHRHGFTLGGGPLDHLDDHVVPLPRRVHHMECTCYSLRHADPGTALEDEDDSRCNCRGVEKLGVQPSGRSWAIAPPPVGSGTHDIRTIDHYHVDVRAAHR